MNIKSILKYIRIRPTMFVGSFENLRKFIIGFNFPNQIKNQEELIDNKFVREFDDWVKDSLIKENEKSLVIVKELADTKTYIQAIEVVEKDEKLQFSKFFTLCDLYFEEKENEFQNKNNMNLYQFILFLEKNKESILFKDIRALIDGFQINLLFHYSSDKYSKEFKKFYEWIIDYIRENYQDEKILKQICSGQDYIYHISLIKEKEEDRKDLFFELVKIFFNN